MDVVGRSTVHVGDDFLLVGASDNGESAPMLKWDSRNSEWIELEVRKGKNKRAMRQSSTKPLPLIPIDGNLLSRSRDDSPICI